MKRITLLTIVFALIIAKGNLLNAQEKHSTMKSLLSAKWKAKWGTIYDFSASEMHIYGFRGNLKKYKYYLSEKLEKVFDETKIGKNKKGKFIIAKKIEGIGMNFRIYRITSLTKDKLHFYEIGTTGKYKWKHVRSLGDKNKDKPTIEEYKAIEK